MTVHVPAPDNAVFWGGDRNRGHGPSQVMSIHHCKSFFTFFSKAHCALPKDFFQFFTSLSLPQNTLILRDILRCSPSLHSDSHKVWAQDSEQHKFHLDSTLLSPQSQTPPLLLVGRFPPLLLQRVPPPHLIVEGSAPLHLPTPETHLPFQSGLLA